MLDITYQTIQCHPEDHNLYITRISLDFPCPQNIQSSVLVAWVRRLTMYILEQVERRHFTKNKFCWGEEGWARQVDPRQISQHLPVLPPEGLALTPKQNPRISTWDLHQNPTPPPNTPPGRRLVDDTKQPTDWVSSTVQRDPTSADWFVVQAEIMDYIVLVHMFHEPGCATLRNKSPVWVLSRVWVTADEAWIGDFIYWTLIHNL
jgi:hypothetical protein